MHVPEEGNSRWSSYKAGILAGVLYWNHVSGGWRGWKSVLDDLDWWDLGLWEHEIATKILLVRFHSVLGKIYWENHSTASPNMLSYPFPWESPDTPAIACNKISEDNSRLFEDLSFWSHLSETPHCLVLQSCYL